MGCSGMWCSCAEARPARSASVIRRSTITVLSHELGTVGERSTALDHFFAERIGSALEFGPIHAGRFFQDGLHLRLERRVVALRAALELRYGPFVEVADKKVGQSRLSCYQNDNTVFHLHRLGMERWSALADRVCARV